MLNSTDYFASTKNNRSQTIAQELSEHNECYVLITCGEPRNGRMEVEMTYGGDRILAEYLVKSASTIMDEEV